MNRIVFSVLSVLFLLLSLIGCTNKKHGYASSTKTEVGSNLNQSEIVSERSEPPISPEDRDVSSFVWNDIGQSSSRPPQDTHTHPTLLKSFEYVLVGQEYFVETTDFCKQLEDIEYTILIKEIAGIDFVYDKDTNEPKQSSSGVYIVGVKKGWERLKVRGKDKNGEYYTEVIDIKILNESDLEFL